MIDPGDYLCHPCGERLGVKTEVGKGIWSCSGGCGNRTARVVAAPKAEEPAKPAAPARRVFVRG